MEKKASCEKKEDEELKLEKARLFRLFSETGSILDYLEYSRLGREAPEKAD